MSNKANNVTVTYLSDAYLFSGGLNDTVTIATLERMQHPFQTSNS